MICNNIHILGDLLFYIVVVDDESMVKSKMADSIRRENNADNRIKNKITFDLKFYKVPDDITQRLIF